MVGLVRRLLKSAKRGLGHLLGFEHTLIKLMGIMVSAALIALIYSHLELSG